ncbi:gamma-glutamyltranspeptidase [Phascolomyces articulosus]|uniref:Gamma-glutamyltranspeptidase n=1 Tax=Phascolomyces articulosus TaxID=60185 RepID=A0AAD5KEZ9_9FUNG|nr:gamma-glutamyltranspeptidase [Phascolomyces articulosus]
MNNKNLFTFITRRSSVYGVDGMVASTDPLATQVGIDILKQGGNAADAAVAVAAAVSVVAPGSTGIGGDAFCLFYNAKTRKVTGLNGSGRTPAKLTLEYLQEKTGVEGISISGTSVHSVTVPGAVAAWIDTVDYFGSGKLSMSTILQPAIELAEHGYWKAKEEQLKEVNNHRNNMLIGGVRAPEEGEMMYLPDLAKTLKTIATDGKNGFYKGPIADSIVDAIQSRGGLMTHEDLASHTSEIVEPISIDYHGYTLWEIPPNGQGITALIALGIIRALEDEHGVDFSKIKHNSAEYLHIIIESLRLAFADTRYHVTDPQILPTIPVEKLLSKEYLSQRAKLVDLNKRNNTIQKGYPEQGSNTACLSVVDREGNACSFIGSLFEGFGTSIIPNNCGFPLHNRGSFFTTIKDHPNCVGPNKRPYHTILPTILTRRTNSGDHEFEASFGIAGSYMQPQGHVQIVMNLVNYLTDPQHTLDLPRISICPPSNYEQANISIHPRAQAFIDINPSIVHLEDGIEPRVIEQLKKMGHICYFAKGQDRLIFGRSQIIRAVHKSGGRIGKHVMAAGCDPRGDGQACPAVMTNSKL